MNFSSAVAILFATASSVEAGENGLRNLISDVGYSHDLGQCTGAKCGIWGDPHIDSCDGKSYDCQGIGLFTLMKNFAFNVQANFVEVGWKEYAQIDRKGWDLPEGASITNDIMIDFKLNETMPSLQFGFGDVSAHDGTFPAEEGCEVNWYYKPPNMKDHKQTKEANVEQCRKRCDSITGCTGISYWEDSKCNVVGSNSNLLEVTNKKWSRVVSGNMESRCGLHAQEMELDDIEERMKHGYVGKQCPLLMWEDGVMKDVSDVIGTGFLYGQAGDKNTVEMKKEKGQTLLEITYTMPDGESKAVIHVKSEGKGPGELWSCHWDVNVCLPVQYSTQFADTTVGLFGTPDGNPNNEWMKPNGIEIPMAGDDAHKLEMDYCLDNWCVSQEESIMTYHGDTTYADHKCHDEPHKDTWDGCVLNVEKVNEVCSQVPFRMKYACEEDCCVGGCDQIKDVMPDFERKEDKPEDPKSADECGDLEDTADTVCPSTEGGVVKLLKTTGTATIPDGGDVFHSIIMDPDPGDNGSSTVRFKVNNPFDSSAHVYVKHDVNVLSGFTNSVCDGFVLDTAGCDTSNEIEVACKEFPGVEPFAVVNVYFASVGLDDSNDAEIDKCCDAADYEPGTGIVEYTFQIECICPDDIIA